EDGIRDFHVTGVQTCALPIYMRHVPPCERYHTELPVHPLSVSLARRHVAHVLMGWGRDTLIDDAQLVISELVTNGIKASTPDERSEERRVGKEGRSRLTPDTE